jgi:hypothetical protein
MRYYFTEHGDYGSAQDMVILDTTNWTSEDWDLVSDCTDSVRRGVALLVDGLRGGAVVPSE